MENQSLITRSKKTNRGITLIALVITIIVLLILAGVSIASLTGDNGLLGKATLAQQNTRAAEVKEEVELALTENEAHKYTGGNKNTKESMVEKLYNAKKLTDAEYNKLMGLNGETEVDAITIGTITIDFSKLESSQSTELQVGDYVKYGDKLKAKTYTTDTDQTGYESTQTFATNTNMLWRVLSVEGNKVELVATQNVLANDNETGLYLQGKKGFLNAEIVLKNLCETLYNSTSGTARSINVKDINDLTEYDPTTYSDDYGESYDFTTGGPFWDKETNEFKPVNSSVTVTNEYYRYRVDASIPLYDTLIETDTEDFFEYWLGSRYADSDGGRADFGVRCVRNGRVRGDSLYGATSYDDGEYDDEWDPFKNAVRPVITLTSGVQVTGGSGTEGDPYKL